MTGPTIHPDLAPLAFLLGTWSGTGHGSYPTIDDFDYGEEVSFRHSGKPFLFYRQRTWDLGTGARPEGHPLHTEAGFWRPGGQGRVEVMLAQPTGIVEVQEGTVHGTAAALTATYVGLSATAKEVTTLERRFEVDGDVLRYRLLMGAVGVSHRLHLEATLTRVME